MMGVLYKYSASWDSQLFAAPVLLRISVSLALVFGREIGISSSVFFFLGGGNDCLVVVDMMLIAVVSSSSFVLFFLRFLFNVICCCYSRVMYLSM